MSDSIRILFLDDMRFRRQEFQKNSIGCTVDFAFNAQQALDFLVYATYDMIYLDHDLKPEHYDRIAPDDKNGFYVASNLLLLEKHFNKIVIIHTLNPIGRKNMKNILKDSFDVWTPEDFNVSELWKIDPRIVLGAIKKLKVGDTI